MPPGDDVVRGPELARFAAMLEGQFAALRLQVADVGRTIEATLTDIRSVQDDHSRQLAGVTEAGMQRQARIESLEADVADVRENGCAQMRVHRKLAALAVDGTDEATGTTWHRHKTKIGVGGGALLGLSLPELIKGVRELFMWIGHAGGAR